MFDRFTERARQVMTYARMEAQKLQNDYIGTEHILLGLVREGTGVGAMVLKELELDLRKVRAEVERLVEQGDSQVTASQLPFTPRAKRVLELALEEAQNLGHNYIGTEHLLLGLIRECDGPAAHVLQRLGVSTDEVREQVVELLGADPTTGSRAGGGREEPTNRGWETMPASPAVDWKRIAQAREEADVILAERLERSIPGIHVRSYLELYPRPDGWGYVFGAFVSPTSESRNPLVVTMPEGRLTDLEKDLPGLIESLVSGIEGKGEGRITP